jgi:hypothetical protein
LQFSAKAAILAQLYGSLILRQEVAKRQFFAGAESPCIPEVEQKQ